MKKSSIKKISAAVIVIAVIVTVFMAAYILSIDQEVSPPSFEFLKGYGPLVKNVESNYPKSRETIFICSFIADFNDVIAKANPELRTLGYSSLASDHENISYANNNKKSEYVYIKFLKNSKYPKTTNSNNRVFAEPKDGWTSVVINIYSKKNKYVCFIQSLRSKLWGEKIYDNSES